MSIRTKSPTLFKVLDTLPDSRMKILAGYSKENAFHRGRQWFGTGMQVQTAEDGSKTLRVIDSAACPVAAAFNVQRDYSKSGWFSAKLDQNLLAAIRHIVENAGGEEGMEQYLKELENTDPIELHDWIERRRTTITQKRRTKKSNGRR